MKAKATGGTVYLVVIGSLLATAGAVFTWLLWQGYQTAAMTRDWNEVEAVVIESVVQERQLGAQIPTEYSHRILYEYRVDGRSYFGERVQLRENRWAKERARAEQQTEKYRTGQAVAAFVDPENPERAVLAHETKAPLYSIWFPIVFFVGGLVVVVQALRKRGR